MISRNSMAYLLLAACAIPTGINAEALDLEWFQGSWEADTSTSKTRNPQLSNGQWDLKDGQFLHFDVKDGTIQAERKGKGGTTTFSYSPSGSDSAIIYLSNGKTATAKRVDTGFCFKPDIPPELEAKYDISTIWFCFSKREPPDASLE